MRFIGTIAFDSGPVFAYPRQPQPQVRDEPLLLLTSMTAEERLVSTYLGSYSSAPTR
jgi:hypothetical protein